MQVGSLVRITDVGSEDTRGIGTVLKFDTYNSQREYPAKFAADLVRHLPAQRDECIIEVLWSDAHIGWILRKRLEVLNESR
jgi:hypothetical protein